MATKEQYDFFKDQYLDEEKRYSDLTKRAEIYFSILSVLLTSIVFKIKDIFELFENSNSFNRTFSFIFFIIALGLFGSAFYFITRALRIKTYQAVIDFENFRNNLGETPPTNEDFFDDRLIDYMYATEKNEIVNEERANDLAKALRFILAGFFTIFIFITIVLIQNI